MLSDQVPIFNVRAVVQETGVKPDTLRAWERRYGLPRPDRSESSHRLYSRRDIETVKWLQAQRKAGLGISKAVKLWSQPEAQGVDSANGTAAAAAGWSATEQQSDRVAQTRQSWISACLEFDEGAAVGALAEAFALFPVERVCFDILLAGLAQIGAGWYDGDVTGQQEHFASAVAIRQIDSLLAAALSLEDLTLLGTEMAWVEGLLRNHGLPADLLDVYMRAYLEAARTHLDQRGAPVVTWIESLS